MILKRQTHKYRQKETEGDTDRDLLAKHKQSNHCYSKQGLTSRSLSTKFESSNVAPLHYHKIVRHLESALPNTMIGSSMHRYLGYGLWCKVQQDKKPVPKRVEESCHTKKNLTKIQHTGKVSSFDLQYFNLVQTPGP